MNVLILSLDEALFDKTREGDTLMRLKAYRKRISSLRVIVSTRRFSAHLINDGITIISAHGRRKILSYWRMYRLTRDITRKHAIDLIVTNDPLLGAIALLARPSRNVRVQISVFDIQLTNPDWVRARFRNRILKWIGTWALRKAESIRTDNSGDREVLVNTLGIHPEIITVIPIAPSKQSQRLYLQARKDERLRTSLVGKNKMILSVGSLLPKKGLWVLTDAMEQVHSKIPDAKLIIIGKGPLRKELERKIRAKSLEKYVILEGSVPYSELPSYFASADLFVLPSLHEGFPRVLMEAALAGTPIVTTQINGAHDMLADGVSARVVPIKNPEALSGAMVELLLDPGKSAQLSRQAQKNAKKLLNVDKNVSELIDSWERTVKSRTVMTYETK